MTVLKHLIHVFLLFGCIGFAFTIAHVMVEEWQGGPAYDPYEIEVARETNSIQKLVKYHPVVQGTKKLNEKTRFLDAMNNYYKEFTDTRVDLTIHPLYVSLNKRSPLNMLLKNPFDINDHIYDMESKPVDGKTFYRKYMSKSLPCVFRREIRDDPLYRNLSAARTKDEMYSVLKKKFVFSSKIWGHFGMEQSKPAPI